MLYNCKTCKSVVERERVARTFGAIIAASGYCSLGCFNTAVVVHSTLKPLIPETATGKLIDQEEENPGEFRGNPKIAAFYRRRRMNEKTKVGSVVQVNETGPEGWQGCLVQVDEMKAFGVQAWAQIPLQGAAYIRLAKEEFDYIGEAVMIPGEENKEV